MKEFSRTLIADVTSAQWKRLATLCGKSGTRLEEAQLQSATGIAPKAALRFLLLVAEEGSADLYLLVFHDGHYATRRKFSSGYQELPWECPECEETIEHEDELRYEVQAVLRDALEFV